MIQRFNRGLWDINTVRELALAPPSARASIVAREERLRTATAPRVPIHRRIVEGLARLVNRD